MGEKEKSFHEMKRKTGLEHGSHTRRFKGHKGTGNKEEEENLY
jgi:hypothetical protein